MGQEKKQWIVQINKKAYGPYTNQQLKQLAELGKINPNTAVRKATSEQWHQAGSIQGLFPKPSLKQKLGKFCHQLNYCLWS